MKLLVAHLLATVLALQLSAQCSSLELAALQDLERAEPAAREAKILALGFDIHKDMLREGASIRVYRKCWSKSIAQKPVYGQLIFRDKNSDLLVFLTLDAAEARALRQSIESRPTGTTSGGSYLGRIFQYHFFSQTVEGQVYFATSIERRQSD